MAIQADEVLTYTQLNERANKLAHYLRFRGVSTEALVPVLLHRSAALYVAWLAVLKAGGAVMPVEPKYPTERMAYMFDDAQATVILTQRDLENRLPPGHGASVLLLDDAEPDWRHGNQDNPVCVGSSSDLAYAIYTSGSTGRPKGVMLEHRSLVCCSE